MIKKYDNTDIEKVSLHDCPLYGFVWDSSGITWKSELILFIDYIDEWICGIDRKCHFRIAPATLIFHNVTGFSYSGPPAHEEFRCIIDNPIIAELKCQKQDKNEQFVHLDIDYYIWQILLFNRFGSETFSGFHFGGTGFSLLLHHELKYSEEQRLQIDIRDRMNYYYEDMKNERPDSSMTEI